MIDQPIGRSLTSGDTALAKMRAEHGLITIEDCHAHIQKLQEINADLLAALKRVRGSWWQTGQAVPQYIIDAISKAEGEKE